MIIEIEIIAPTEDREAIQKAADRLVEAWYREYQMKTNAARTYLRPSPHQINTHVGTGNEHLPTRHDPEAYAEECRQHGQMPPTGR